MRRKTPLLLFTIAIVLASILVHIASSQSEEWLSIENEYFIVRYRPGYYNDALVTLNTAMIVRNITMEKYPHELSFKVEIYIHTEYRTMAWTLAGCGRAAIHIMTPSWEGWRGYEHFKRALNHEYVHAPFYNDLYCKPVGYRDPPDWFSQGIAEYISGNYNPYYEKLVREALQDGDFSINDQYAWGLYIVEFMYAKYGQEKVINLIKSDAPTFAKALRKELNVTPLEFEDLWRKYLAEKFGVEYIPRDGYKDLYERLLAEYESLKTAYDKLNITYYKLLAEHEALKTAYTILNASYYKLKEDYDSLNANYTSLKLSYDKLRFDYEALLVRYNSTLAELNYWIARYRELNATYYNLKDLYEGLSAEYRSLLTKYNSLRLDYETLNASHTLLKSMYERLRIAHDELNATYHRLKALYDEAKSRYEDLLLRYNALKSEHENLALQHAKLGSEYDALKASYDKLRIDYENLKANYDELKTTHDRYVSELTANTGLMYIFLATTIVFIATTIYFAVRRPKIT